MGYPQKQNVFVPLGAGLQTDVDDKLLPLGKLLEAENCFVLRTGELIKRYGFTSLPTVGNVPGQLGTHLGALVNAGTPLETLATPTSTQWTAATGNMRPGISPTLTKIAAGALTSDVAYGAGFYWVLYQDSDNVGAPDLLHAVAVDEATGHRAWETTFVPAGGATSFSSWRVVYCAGRAVFVYMDLLGAMNFAVVNPTGFAVTTAATAAGVAIGGPYNLYWFDVTTRSDTTVVVGFPDAGLLAKAIDFVPSTLAITIWVPRTAAGVTIPVSSLGWVKDDAGSGKLALETAQAAAGLRVQWDFPTVGATRNAAATHVIDAAFTGASAFLTGVTTAATATGEYLLAYDQGTVPDRVIRRATRIGGVITTGIVARGASLRSKLWSYGTDYFLVGAFETDTQGTHYVIRVATPASAAALPTPVAKIEVRQGTGGSLAHMSAVVSPRAGTFTIGMNYTPRFDVVPNANGYGVELATLNHSAYLQSVVGIPREAIGSLFVPGGTVGQFDGATFAEAGFAYSPEQPTLTPQATGGMTASGVYWYVDVYVYTDAQGRTWRSAGSVPKSVTLGGGDGSVLMASPTLRLTGRTAMQIEHYRGAAGDEVLFQKVGITPNDPTVDTVAFTDTVSDGTLAGLAFLYTNGGVLDNDTPPGFIALAEAQSRTFGIATDDPQALWYTKEHALRTGAEWSEVLVFDVRDQHGPMRVLAQLDDRIVIFKNDAIYVVNGSGPNVLGQGGSYQAQLVCAGIGCSNAQSVCETRDGVIFRSTGTRAGIFLLGRGLEVTYIGAAVQRYNNETITGAVFLSTYLQARFYTAEGRTLVYDLVTSIWTTFTGQPAQASVSWNGVPVYQSSSTLNTLREDQFYNTLTDDGNATTMLVGSPWIQANQIRGYQRFYRQELVGEVEQAPVMISLALYKDFTPTVLTSDVASGPVGVIDRELRYSAKLAALRAVITDSGSTTGVLRVSGLTLVLGVKAGLKPVAVGSRFT